MTQTTTENLKSTILKYVVLISVIVIIGVGTLAVLTYVTTQNSTSEILSQTRELGSISREINNNILTGVEIDEALLQTNANRLSQLETQITQNLNARNTRQNIYISLIVVIVVVALLIKISVVNTFMERLVKNLETFKQYVNNLKENRRQLGNVQIEQMSDVKADIDAIYNTHVENVQELYRVIRELETTGKIDIKLLQVNKIIDSREYEKTLNNLNTKINTTYTDLKQISGLDKNNLNLWQFIKESVDRIKLDTTEKEKEILEISDMITKLTEGNFGSRIGIKNETSYGKAKGNLIDLQEMLAKFTKEVTESSNNTFGIKLLGNNYAGDFGRAKTGFDRAVEINKGTISALKEEIEKLRRKESDMKIQTTTRRPTRSTSSASNPVHLPMTPVLNLSHKDIDFTGRSFGKY